jgi:GNAT superfamily N-acetyltransferase
MHRIRDAEAEDRGFVIEMARFACTLEDRPLPDPDAPAVLACLPLAMSAAVIATNDDEPRLGAAWWHLHEPTLVLTTDGSPLPELTMAVAEDARGHGVGTALIEGTGHQRRNAFQRARVERPPPQSGRPPLHAQRLSSCRQRPRMVRRGNDTRATRLNLPSAGNDRPDRLAITTASPCSLESGPDPRHGSVQNRTPSLGRLRSRSGPSTDVTLASAGLSPIPSAATRAPGT